METPVEIPFSFVNPFFPYSGAFLIEAMRHPNIAMEIMPVAKAME
jgi:hypothetical protein